MSEIMECDQSQALSHNDALLSLLQYENYYMSEGQMAQVSVFIIWFCGGKKM